MNVPIFSLCHATARLPDGWRPAYQAWLENCDNPSQVEYVLAMDLADRERFPTSLSFPRIGEIGASPCGPRLPQIIWTFNPGAQNAVAAWNCAAAASNGRFIIQVADDLWPPLHWDTELLKVIPDLDGEYAIEVRTGTSADDEWRRLMAHSFLTRKYYERYGYLFHPDYEGMYADDEFSEKARRDGVMIDTRHLLFHHHHWIRTNIPFDEIYARQNSQERYDLGLKILGQRRAQGFPK